MVKLQCGAEEAVNDDKTYVTRKRGEGGFLNEKFVSLSTTTVKCINVLRCHHYILFLLNF